MVGGPFLVQAAPLRRTVLNGVTPALADETHGRFKALRPDAGTAAEPHIRIDGHTLGDAVTAEHHDTVMVVRRQRHAVLAPHGCQQHPPNVMAGRDRHGVFKNDPALDGRLPKPASGSTPGPAPWPPP